MLNKYSVKYLTVDYKVRVIDVEAEHEDQAIEEMEDHAYMSLCSNDWPKEVISVDLEE